MNKLYSTDGNLIGYNSDGINTSSRKQLFDIEAGLIETKLNALGVPDSDRECYYLKIIEHYRVAMQGLKIREGIPYFKGTDVKWRYKPISCKSMFSACDDVAIYEFDRKKACKTDILDISSLDTSNTTDMQNMFEYCTAKIIDISSFNTSKVTDMGCMFSRCKAQSLDLSSFDTSQVTSMGGMFDSLMCDYSKAGSLDLSSFNTSKVEDMCYMFAYCNIRSLDLSSFDTRQVTAMESTFYGCEIELLDLSSFDISKLTDMEGIFDYCEIQHIKINREAFEKICNSEEAFRDSEGMTPEKFKSICEIV